MKINFLIISLLLLSVFAKATVWTVDNNINSLAQFTTIQEAIGAASNGDTIMVAGSNTNYASIIINKKLTLIGPGYNPKIGYPASISNIGLDTIPNFSGASGTRIIGFKFGYIGVVGGNDVIKNVTIERNKISSANFGSYWVVKNNIIIECNVAVNTQCIISNNIFINISASNSLTFLARSGALVLFSNNVVITNGGCFSNNASNITSSYYIDNCIVTNNIFYGSSPNNPYDVNCTWNNNISYSTINDNFNLSGSNSGTGNIVGADPMFTSVSSTTFDYSYDFHLQAGSPGKNAGTDGTDIGIYGGMYPFPSGGDVPYQTSPVPNVPQILEMNVINQVLNIDGTLQIQIHAKSNN